jgi:hypothetical protein
MAEKSARAALEARKDLHFGANYDAAEQDQESMMITLSLAAQNKEAAALMDGTVSEYQNLFTTRLWRDRITQAQRGQYPRTGRGRN